MSDELPPGTQSLEDEPSSPPPAAEPAAPAAAPPEADKPAEVESVEVGGEKYVPVSALQAERQRRQELQQKAARADELEQFAREAQPYVQFLKANPQVMQPRPEPPPQTGPPPADPDAIEAAKLYDFYRADGTPDVERGARAVAMMEKRAGRITQQAIQPLQQSSAQEASTRNYALALQMKDADGRTPNPDILRTLWQNLEPRHTADQAVASIMAAAALGMERMTTKSGPAPPTRDPVVTEPVGAAPRQAAPMTELETRVAAHRGADAKRWSEATKGFRANRPSPLED